MINTSSMKRYVVHQITKKYYSKISDVLQKLGLDIPENLFAQLQEIISDHKMVVDSAKKLRKKTNQRN
jgi:hypothetical protein